MHAPEAVPVNQTKRKPAFVREILPASQSGKFRNLLSPGNLASGSLTVWDPAACLSVFTAIDKKDRDDNALADHFETRTGIHRFSSEASPFSAGSTTLFFRSVLRFVRSSICIPVPYALHCGTNTPPVNGFHQNPRDTPKGHRGREPPCPDSIPSSAGPECPARIFLPHRQKRDPGPISDRTPACLRLS